MIAWSEDLACDITEIDRQHKELFNLFRQLSEEVEQGKSKEAVARATAFLEDYIRGHFAMEEHYMKVLQYPEYETHRNDHALFINDFMSFKAIMEKTADMSVIAAEIEGSLYHWLLSHVGTTDRNMAIFIKQHRPV